MLPWKEELAFNDYWIGALLHDAGKLVLGFFFWDHFEEIIRRILILRLERARLLGYHDFSAYRTANTMAGTALPSSFSCPRRKASSCICVMSVNICASFV